MTSGSTGRATEEEKDRIRSVPTTCFLSLLFPSVFEALPVELSIARLSFGCRHSAEEMTGRNAQRVELRRKRGKKVASGYNTSLLFRYLSLPSSVRSSFEALSVKRSSRLSLIQLQSQL